MTQRISLKETYDNRDVIAWLVKQKEQIDEILADLDERIEAGDNIEITPSGNERIISLKDTITGPITFEDRIMCSDYMTSVARAYNAANVDDVVTIGSLAANPSVIRSTGEQNQLAATLLFNSWGSRPKPPVNAQFTGAVPPANDQTIWLMGCYDNANVMLGKLFIRALSNGSTQLRVELRNTDGTSKTVTLAAGDVI